MRKVTLSGGKLDGKSFLVADDSDTLIHHAAHNGQYRLNGAYGEWVEYGEVTVDITPDTSALVAALADELPTDLPGLALHAKAGRRVLIVGHTLRAADELWQTVAEAAADDESLLRIRHANGDARIEFKSGGFVRAVSPRSLRARGIAADVLYVSTEAASLGSAELASVMATLASSSVGLVIHEGA
ncbi:hypothetical protein [Microbacterium sp. NPDC091662]|uniref:hypothetical protein n=1 Tax=Microbacterium sp. NPDC091662 TaxID=3364211 RepID=UPI00382C4218